MKKLATFAMVMGVLVLGTGSVRAQSLADFERYFVDKTMRIDYYHTGDANEEFVSVDRIYQQGIWAGSRKKLIDTFNNGRYYAKMYDAESGTLLFSKGFDSYFGEYQTTGAASEGIKHTYHETALLPYPRQKIRFVLEARKKDGALTPIHDQTIDPSDFSIARESLVSGVEVTNLLQNGDPHGKVDIAIIAEGYTAEEKEKFQKDLKKFTEVFFRYEPYASQKANFNMYGVFKPSLESGCDEPSHGIFKQTALGVTFDSLGSERYLLTEDNRSLRDIAAHVPYDALYIMVNHDRYGGGGIYNFYCTFTTDNQWYEYLFIHEFGHAFGGLADEYYTSSVAYSEFYPQGQEPNEPNITALLNPDALKWKALATPGTAIPTPWEKAGFDEISVKYQAVREEMNGEIAQLKREGAPEKEVEAAEKRSEQMSRKNAKEVDHYLAGSDFVGQVGAFQGAGYASEGFYRPMLDCMMFTRGAKPFCQVCQNALSRAIEHYLE